MKINEKINELERQLNELKASLKEEAKDDRPITERVKTFKDACRVLGDNHQFVSEWSVVSEITNISPDLRAYFKLRIITAALNEGWEPEFTESEQRYSPWFEKTSNGIAFADVCFDDSFPYIGITARLAFKTSELAEYAGKQFEDIWADYLSIRE